MKITLSTDGPTKVRADALALGVKLGKLEEDPFVAQLDEASRGALLKTAKVDDFQGKPGEAIRLSGLSGELPTLLVFGLGDGEISAKDVRAFAAKAAQAASKCKTLAIALPGGDSVESTRAAAEGVYCGSYRYSRYLTGDRLPKAQIEAVRLLVEKDNGAHKKALEQGKILGEAIALARDLVNAPPNDLTPTAFADIAKSEAETHGLRCKVWDKKGIEKLGMPLLLAVNRGSDEEPRVVHLQWRPKGLTKDAKKVTFVGKGLTFDAGGLCIKPAKSMLDMKCDMAGAAVTVATLIAAARMEIPLEIHGFFGATENMLGGSAYRPGDVFPSLDGKFVEIINTDAEGRLVLADVLTYAVRETKPDFLIDHATLTGASMVALGPWTASLFANDDEMGTLYAQAAKEAGEAFWRMPLDEDLRETLKSDIADLKHTGDAYGGSITAALFLREFISDAKKWVHCDIAGPSFQERPHGVHPKGGTGFGVATAIRFLENLAAR